MSVNLFKNAINGYNRSEVDQYIYHISKKHDHERKNYEKKIEILEAEIEKLKWENRETSEMLKEDEAIISAFRAKLNPDASEDTLSDSENTAAEQSTDPVESEETLLIEKSKRYDEISRQLGEIIINANADAAAIIRRAEDEAAKIKEEAKNEAESMKKEAEEKAASLKKDASEKIRRAALAATESLSELSNCADAELK